MALEKLLECIGRLFKPGESSVVLASTDVSDVAGSSIAGDLSDVAQTPLSFDPDRFNAYLSSVPEQDRARTRAFFDFVHSIVPPSLPVYGSSAARMVYTVPDSSDDLGGYDERLRLPSTDLDHLKDYFRVLAATPNAGRTGGETGSIPFCHSFPTYGHVFPDGLTQYARTQGVELKDSSRDDLYTVLFVQTRSSPEILALIEANPLRLDPKSGDSKYGANVAHAALNGRRAIDPDVDALVAHVEGMLDSSDLKKRRSLSRDGSYVRIWPDGRVTIRDCVPLAAKEAVEAFFATTPAVRHGKDLFGMDFRILEKGMVQTADFGPEWDSRRGYCWGNYHHYAIAPQGVQERIAGK
ncbi:hypothetical protein HYW21_04070 [Candidatus Woesearchaeota archaeon]|nr:hypothetical protein [Candidatus Woesearchaeota archaeon]